METLGELLNYVTHGGIVGSMPFGRVAKAI
jgi:hypothetical protein